MEYVELSPELCFNPHNAVSSDEFSVDQLLDFSNHDDFLQHETPDDGDKPSTSLSIAISAQQIHRNSIVSDLPSLPSTELPADDLANLEWLSDFVEDSFSGFSTPFHFPFPCPGISSLMKSSNQSRRRRRTTGEQRFRFVSGALFQDPVPVRARSKRTRTSYSH
ncbi:unnamed protein product [Citrullus colocynthis]|uniref:GATA transcription factor n=1 Tax=Citrullus colocynthis TaxID=252529 RepID=A0ABP0XT57_9ROSI